MTLVYIFDHAVYCASGGVGVRGGGGARVRVHDPYVHAD